MMTAAKPTESLMPSLFAGKSRMKRWENGAETAESESKEE